MGPAFVVTTLLTSLCAGLGWLVYEEARRPPVTTGAISAGAKPPARVSATTVRREMDFVLPPIDAFQEITARPLFNVSRRPIVVESPEPAASPSELHVMLSGIVIGAAQQIAHIRAAPDQRVQALRVGDVIEGWRIEAIEPDRVVLRSGDRLETVFMQKYGPGSTAKGKTGPTSGATVDPRTPRTRDRSGQTRRERYRRYNRGGNR